MGIVKVLTVFLSVLFVIHRPIYIYIYDRLGAELTLLNILTFFLLNEYKTYICKCTSVQAFFCVLYT